MENEALLKKAEYKKKIGRFTEARNIYIKILRKNPHHLYAFFLLGTLFAQQHKMAEAIRYLEKAVQIKPDFPDLQNNLGNVYKATGDFIRAKQCYLHCLKLNPHHARAHHGLGTIFLEDFKEKQKALECFRKALSLDPNIAEAHFGYGMLLVDYGNSQGLMHLEKANQINPHQEGLLNRLGTAYLKFNKPQEAVLRLNSALEQNPDDTVAKYFLCIATGRKPDKELRERYVEEIFNKYSVSFEQDLVERLGYKIPSTARETIENLYGSAIKFNHMADIGCGTGLGGLAFRDCTERLTGIDLSSRMLQKAAQKNIYDSLLHGEVIDVLDNLDGFFDFFLATDLLSYFQELNLLLTAIRNRSSAGALLVFSTESNDSVDFVVRESGRVAHSAKYIHALAETFNINIVAEKRLPIRKDHAKWIEGDLFICELP